MSLEEAQGYVVLATLAVPLLAAFALVLTPGREKMLVRYISAVTGAIVCGLSIYIFAAYQVGGDQVQMTLRWAWVENTAFLGENGITLYLAVDGISATMALLTGVVAFAGALAAWKLDFRNKDFYILYWTLLAGVFGTFFSFSLFFFFFFFFSLLFNYFFERFSLFFLLFSLLFFSPSSSPPNVNFGISRTFSVSLPIV